MDFPASSTMRAGNQVCCGTCPGYKSAPSELPGKLEKRTCSSRSPLKRSIGLGPSSDVLSEKHRDGQDLCLLKTFPRRFHPSLGVRNHDSDEVWEMKQGISGSFSGAVLPKPCQHPSLRPREEGGPGHWVRRDVSCALPKPTLMSLGY